MENQGELGSCTGNAIVSAVEYLRYPSKVNYSRLFVYYNERVMEGSVEIDNGAEIRTGIKVLNKQGVCRESLWKYDISKFTHKPSAKAYEAALAIRVSQYKRITSLNGIRTALAAGLPVVFGFTVFSSFHKAQVEERGLMLLPKPYESQEGGHAVVAVGYDDDLRVLIVRNSWGTEWGDAGYFYMPYDFVSNKGWASDFWTFKL